MVNIDHIYCINLESRPDRWKNMDAQFNRLGLDVERFAALQGVRGDYNPVRKTLGQIGCLKSHKAVVEDALKNNYESILIFEDDITICQDFSSRLSHCSEDMVSDWDSLYLGGTFFHNQPVQVSKYLYKNVGTFGTFAFVLRKTIFSELLQLYSTHRYNADNCHAEHIQYQFNSYIIIPFLVHINRDISDVIPGEVTPESLYNRVYEHYKPVLKEE